MAVELFERGSRRFKVATRQAGKTKCDPFIFLQFSIVQPHTTFPLARGLRYQGGLSQATKNGWVSFGKCFKNSFGSIDLVLTGFDSDCRGFVCFRKKVDFSVDD